MPSKQGANSSYIAEHSGKVSVGGWDDECYDIEVENNGPQSNDVVEVGAGQSNQPE